ncbi:Hexosyltransferase [Caligus rogercresseyi]|uniref:Hexosyltransferase n=1 Tax=Caligus rogercresseyi TaxID=217165 RepID=A0A7T8QV62_CALRO|nr:Hexosyltransferase [Caligus rogercresseyi]
MLTGDVIPKLLAASSRYPKPKELLEGIYVSGLLSMESSLLLIDMMKLISRTWSNICKAAVFLSCKGN